MTTFTTIAAGVSGAIGSDYLQSRDQLIFVEFGGNLSAVDAVRTSHSYSILGKGYIEYLNISKPFCSFVFLLSMELSVLSDSASPTCSLDCLQRIPTPYIAPTLDKTRA